jgi:hypothetical protein
MIKVLAGDAIDHNGIIFNTWDAGYNNLYSKFVKRGITFKAGAIIEEKERGRPRTSNRERLQLYVQKNHIEMVRTFKQGLDIEDYIVKKVNEGQERDVKPYTIETIPFNLIEFWLKEFNKNKKL